MAFFMQDSDVELQLSKELHLRRLNKRDWNEDVALILTKFLLPQLIWYHNFLIATMHQIYATLQ